MAARIAGLKIAKGIYRGWFVRWNHRIGSGDLQGCSCRLVTILVAS